MAGIAGEESAVGRSLEGYRVRNVANRVMHWRNGDLRTKWRMAPPQLHLRTGILMTVTTMEAQNLLSCMESTHGRSLRSNAFEVGGYKWYILIYPEVCGVCNHLSLFLRVANHDKLLPAVVNKDPKKLKYSDTLHCFWKKEHDWGWKKFMELSEVSDGFVDAHTLIIKAQEESRSSIPLA